MSMSVSQTEALGQLEHLHWRIRWIFYLLWNSLLNKAFMCHQIFFATLLLLRCCNPDVHDWVQDGQDINEQLINKIKMTDDFSIPFLTIFFFLYSVLLYSEDHFIYIVKELCFTVLNFHDMVTYYFTYLFTYFSGIIKPFKSKKAPKIRSNDLYVLLTFQTLTQLEFIALLL